MSFADWWVPPWACLPLIAANMLPVVFGRGARPLDEYPWWPKQWPLGKGKTLRGFVTGWLLAVIATRAIALGAYYASGNESLVSIWDFNHSRSWRIMLAMGFGALLGDLIESIIKRRRGIPRGNAWWPWDQLDAVIGGFILTALVDWPWFYLTIVLHWQLTAIWIGIYLLVHPLFSLGAYLLKLKSVPH